ncbi:BadF/BadG/BcrA/BcrD ATPase family protein [Reinekea sp.]|jgi:glucosamine kinase|uniref:BadF/BadG/BcrA/BcrD ATPase family protein n=1 Tax=Reinekea sp. TaxID=1970455 RepID=UPI003988A444
MKSPLNYLIGIDGGGTRCRARITDLHGSILGEAVSGSANVFQNDALAWQSVSASIDEAIQAAKLPANARQKAYVVAGLAGAEVSSAVEKFFTHVENIGHLEILTDAQIACLGAHTLKNGAIFIVGTGTVGIAQKDEHWKKIGGWGFPLNDEGGGAWLGMQAIKVAIKQYDGLIASSCLSEKVWQKFPSGIDELVAWSQHASSGDYGQFSPLVTDAYEQNDLHAKLIIEEQAAVLTEKISALATNNIPLCLMGGLASWAQPLLPPAIQQQLKKPDGDALTGALLLARKRMSA